MARFHFLIFYLIQQLSTLFFFCVHISMHCRKPESIIGQKNKMQVEELREKMRENERYEKRRRNEEGKNKNQTTINRNAHTSDRSANYSYNHFTSVQLQFIFLIFSGSLLQTKSFTVHPSNIFTFNSIKSTFKTVNYTITVSKKKILYFQIIRQKKEAMQ